MSLTKRARDPWIRLAVRNGNPKPIHLGTRKKLQNIFQMDIEQVAGLVPFNLEDWITAVQ